MEKENYKEICYHNGNKVKKIGYYKNGNKSYVYYFLDDKLHKKNGPAIIRWYENGNKESESYCKNGKSHKKNGPASICWFENGNKFYESYKRYEYFLDGKEIKKEELSKLINIEPKKIL